MGKAVILGSGLTGLSLALALEKEGHDVLIIEPLEKIGGILSDTLKGGYRLNSTPFYVAEGAAHARFRIWLEGSSHDPTDLIKLSNFEKFKLKYLAKKNDLDPSLKDYFIATYGKRLYNALFDKLIQKSWGSADRLSIDLVHSQNLRKLLTPKKFYPYDPFKLISKFVDKLGGGVKIMLNTKPLKFRFGKENCVAKIVTDHGEYSADWFFSTIPLKDLFVLLENPPVDVLNELNELRFRKRKTLFIATTLKGAPTWTEMYFPEENFIFSRLINTSHFIKNPTTVFAVELNIDPDKKYANYTNQDLEKNILKQLSRCHLIDQSKILFTSWSENDYGLPILFKGYLTALNKVYDFLKNYPNLLTLGRLGAMNSLSLSDTLDLNKQIVGGLGPDLKDLYDNMYLYDFF